MELAARPPFILTPHLRALQGSAARRGKAENRPVARKTENMTHAFFDLYADLPLWERQARSLAYAFENEPPLVFPGERVHGMFYSACDPMFRVDRDTDPRWREFSAMPATLERTRRELPELIELLAPPDHLNVGLGCSPAHIAWRYDWPMRRGLDAMIAEHRRLADETDDAKGAEFHLGVAIAFEGILAANRANMEALRRLRREAETDEERRMIDESVAVMERVPAEPARNWREAVQSFYTIWQAVMYEDPHGGNSPGRLDYFLWPWLKDEYESGAISYQEATSLVAEMFIKIDERVHTSDGHVNTIVVGGVGPDGEDAVTPLTFMMLDAFEALNITHPAVYTRISEKNPPEYVERAVTYLLKGGNRGQVLNDEALIAAQMKARGIPFEDAAMYVCGGCMEISPHGMNSDLLFAFTFNVAKTLEFVVTGGEDLVSGERRLDLDRVLPDYASFDDLYDAYIAELRRELHLKFRQLDIGCEEMARLRPAYVQSSMLVGCPERGRNQHDGGVRYPNYGAAPLAVQNAADSLFAIRRAVFDDKFCSAEELLDALREDFKGNEALRRRLLALPKFGTGDAEADGMMRRLMNSVCDIFDAYTNRNGGCVHPVILTFTWAPSRGRALGATADGRPAGVAIAHGLTPQREGMREGLTTAVASHASLDLERVSGGASTMWDMDSAWVTQELLESVVRTFLKLGGQIFQGNMTSVADLEEARKAPDRWPHLIVRVGGYSARFTGLSEDLQAEIIERHRHAG